MRLNPEPTLHPARFKWTRDSRIPIWRALPTVSFSHGRDALWSLGQLIRHRARPAVLLPSYLCDVAILPFDDLDVRFYETGEDLTVYPEEIDRQITDATGLVVVVNYFGFPQPHLSEISDVCRRRGVALCLDAAHDLVTPEGCVDVCDFVLWSPHKQLPIPDGAALHCLSVADRIVLSNARRRGRTLGRTMLTIARLTYEGVFRARREVGDVSSAEVATSFSDNGGWGSRPRGTGARASALSWFLADRLDVESAIRKRRENYRVVEQALTDGAPGRPVHAGLPANVCPYLFPFLLDPHVDARKAIADCDLPAYFWPRLASPMSSGKYDRTVQLARRMMAVPIHQDLEPSELEAAASQLCTQLRQSSVAEGGRVANG